MDDQYKGHKVKQGDPIEHGLIGSRVRQAEDAPSLLGQDPAGDTKPAAHDTIAEDSVKDLDPQRPILEDE